MSAVAWLVFSAIGAALLLAGYLLGCWAMTRDRAAAEAWYKQRIKDLETANALYEVGLDELKQRAEREREDARRARILKETEAGLRGGLGT